MKCCARMPQTRHPNVIGRQFSWFAGIARLCQHLGGPACEQRRRRGSLHPKSRWREKIRPSLRRAASSHSASHSDSLATPRRGVTGTVRSSESGLLILDVRPKCLICGDRRPRFLRVCCCFDEAALAPAYAKMAKSVAPSKTRTHAIEIANHRSSYCIACPRTSLQPREGTAYTVAAACVCDTNQNNADF